MLGESVPHCSFSSSLSKNNDFPIACVSINWLGSFYQIVLNFFLTLFRLSFTLHLGGLLAIILMYNTSFSICNMY